MRTQINQNLFSFLNNKTLFYKDINYDIIVNAWSILERYIKLPYVIHIIGTNGKGSTGRYLSHILHQKEYKVLHYSSPHILDFNERIWINGNNCSNKELALSHNFLCSILSKYILDKLTYFEYTTLLALYLSNNFDYLILEAGLGGEFDATNIVNNNLTIITTIGFDHIDFLGNTIDKIATTKMKSCNNSFIIGKQIYKKDIQNVKNNILKDKKEIYFDENIAMPRAASKLPLYLQNNLKLALNVLKYLNIEFNNFIIPDIFGRFNKIATNITIDVGHNVLSAKALLEEFLLKKEKIILIYNSYNDKDYQQILKIMKPIIDELSILAIDDERIVKSDDLELICKTLGIAVNNYDKIDPNKKYLVFGSFKVVEKFLKREQFE